MKAWHTLSVRLCEKALCREGMRLRPLSLRPYLLCGRAVIQYFEV